MVSMSICKLSGIFFSVAVVTLTLKCKETTGLANSAVYIIQNEGTNQCISAGPVEKASQSKLTLLKQGSPLSKPCSNTSTLLTTDFGQQWSISIIKEEVGRKLYQAQIAMRNTQYEDPLLHAKLRGEFISYFPKIVTLTHRNNSAADEFFIADPATGHCLTDEIDSKQLKFANCWNESMANSDGGNQKFQMWNFTLVNEIQSAREHRKLAKGSAYLWS